MRAQKDRPFPPHQNKKQWTPTDRFGRNSPFSLHFFLGWFQGPDWKPFEFSACRRFRRSHPSQTQRQRGIIWRLQPRSFPPYEVIHTHTFPIISPTWFPFNTFNLPNTGSVDSKLITARTLFLLFFVRAFFEGLYGFQNERERWWAATSTLLKIFINTDLLPKTFVKIIIQLMLYCSHDVKRHSNKINTAPELSCEYLIPCSKPKRQLWRIGVNLFHLL